MKGALSCLSVYLSAMGAEPYVRDNYVPPSFHEKAKKSAACAMRAFLHPEGEGSFVYPTNIALWYLYWLSTLPCVTSENLHHRSLSIIFWDQGQNVY